MLLPQEVAARVTLPALRALVAKKLIEEHGFSQRRVARALGLTQAAVSNYLRSTRALHVEEVPELHRFATDIAGTIADGADMITVMFRFAEACNDILASRLMCGLHGRLDPDLDVDSCHLCDSHAGPPLIRAEDLRKK